MDKKLITKSKYSDNDEAIMGKPATYGLKKAPIKVHYQYRPTYNYIDDGIEEDKSCELKPKKKSKNKITPKKFTASNYGVNPGPFASSVDFFNDFNKNNKKGGNI